MKQSLTKSLVVRSRAIPKVVAVSVPPLAAVLADVRSAFFGLCVHTGKEVLAAMMEADRVELCGAKGRPNADRHALRGGHTQSLVTLCGRQIALQRPRALRGGRGVVAGELSLGGLWVIDGAKALRRAIRDLFGDSALVQLCQVHKLRNVLDHLPKTLHASVRWVGAALHEAQRGFRRFRGHRDLRKLCAALNRHCKPQVVTTGRKAAQHANPEPPPRFVQHATGHRPRARAARQKVNPTNSSLQIGADGRTIR